MNLYPLGLMVVVACSGNGDDRYEKCVSTCEAAIEEGCGTASNAAQCRAACDANETAATSTGCSSEYSRLVDCAASADAYGKAVCVTEQDALTECASSSNEGVSTEAFNHCFDACIGPCREPKLSEDGCFVECSDVVQALEDAAPQCIPQWEKLVFCEARYSDSCGPTVCLAQRREYSSCVE